MSKDVTPNEIFEALSHPIRLKILESLEKSPSNFSDLKRMARIESSGHLTFHLDKLKGLVAINAEGNYTLTDDGREALRLVSNLATNRCNNDNRNGKNGNNAALAVLGILLVASVVIAATAVMGTQITMNNVNHLNREMFDNLWIDTINAKQHMQSALSAIEAGQFDAATIALSKAEVYVRRIGSDMPVPMGAELSTFYDYVRPNLRTLADQLGAVELSVANGSVTEDQISFLQAYGAGLSILEANLSSVDNRYSITNIDRIVSYFNDLVNSSANV